MELPQCPREALREPPEREGLLKRSPALAVLHLHTTFATRRGTAKAAGCANNGPYIGSAGGVHVRQNVYIALKLHSEHAKHRRYGLRRNRISNRSRHSLTDAPAPSLLHIEVKMALVGFIGTRSEHGAEDAAGVIVD
jgi:hypothetical protein